MGKVSLLGNSASVWAFLYITVFPSWKLLVYKASFWFLFCFGGGSFVLFFYLPQIEMKSASHEVFC